MSIEKNLNKILKNHEKRILALEAVINKSKETITKARKKSLPEYIVELRDNHFFSQPKTADETHGKLKAKYHCEPNRVAVALLRLSNRKELRKATKTVNGKKCKAYVW
jgi:hypothetical protein